MTEMLVVRVGRYELRRTKLTPGVVLHEAQHTVGHVLFDDDGADEVGVEIRVPKGAGVTSRQIAEGLKQVVAQLREGAVEVATP